MAIVLVLILVLVVLGVLAGVKTVPQGQVWTVERFGAFTRVLNPGLGFLVPWMERIGRRINVQETVLEIPEQTVITRDNATVAVDGIVYYRVMEAEKAAYQVANLPLALTALATTNIRAVIGGMELDATLSSRERINSSLLTTLDGATEPWGAKVSRVEIRKIEPPENLVRAMNLQMTAERERRAVVAKADGEREADIKRAEGQKQAQVLAAEGEKQALILTAEGRRQAAFLAAEARERQGQADAVATGMVSDAAREHGEAALKFFVAQNYVGALQSIASGPGTRLVVVPVEAAAFAGGIGQALELLQAARPSP
jgi:regulator of protease activity HflC (stomatin/prohibitin superfamily)